MTEPENHRVIWDGKAWVPHPTQADVDDLRATVAELHGLIRDLADPDPCWFDHHGYCQAHGWMDTEPPCADGRAQKILAALDGDTPKETT